MEIMQASNVIYKEDLRHQDGVRMAMEKLKGIYNRIVQRKKGETNEDLQDIYEDLNKCFDQLKAVPSTMWGEPTIAVVNELVRRLEKEAKDVPERYQQMNSQVLTDGSSEEVVGPRMWKCVLDEIKKSLDNIKSKIRELEQSDCDKARRQRDLNGIIKELNEWYKELIQLSER